MKTKMVLILLMVLIGGCYSPNWYRANTTYAELKADSEWCKNQTKLGAPRSEMIEQYEVCMRGKGYELKGKDQYSRGEPIRVEQKEGPPIEIDRGAKVYVGILGTNTPLSSFPQYNYFHKRDCKQIWNISIEEVTVAEAIARGKRVCPDCFR